MKLSSVAADEAAREHAVSHDADTKLPCSRQHLALDPAQREVNSLAGQELKKRNAEIGACKTSRKDVRIVRN